MNIEQFINKKTSYKYLWNFVWGYRGETILLILSASNRFLNWLLYNLTNVAFFFPLELYFSLKITDLKKGKKWSKKKQVWKWIIKIHYLFPNVFVFFVKSIFFNKQLFLIIQPISW